MFGSASGRMSNSHLPHVIDEEAELGMEMDSGHVGLAKLREEEERETDEGEFDNEETGLVTPGRRKERP